MKIQDLYNESDSIRFYEHRYSHGYMDEWPEEKKQRVFQIIRNLPLPATGDALDFGCGNGVFTTVIKQALPGWNVYGTDISGIAIKNASQRFSNCIFFSAADEKYKSVKFDFLFTHHVLEHVFSIDEVSAQINTYLKPDASMLHILPCANENSFEYTICSMRSDGINTNMEGRFFFEDEGHVRRLSTIQLNSAFNKKNFSLKQAYYANQYYGALKWLSETNKKFILNFTDPAKAVDEQAKKMLLKYRRLLLFLFYCKRMKRTGNRENLKGLKQVLKLPFKAAIYPFAAAIESYYNYRATKEWEIEKNKSNGSEMYVYFARQQNHN
jgi:SAM-dependent methyltransferase